MNVLRPVSLSFVALGLSALAPVAFAASGCTHKNFTIGFEIVAKEGPNVLGEYLYKTTPIRCNAAGQVIYDSGLGFSENYEMGWFLPAKLMDEPQVQGLAYNSRTFKNKCSTMLVAVHRLYKGYINQVNLNGTYPPASQPYVDVFTEPLYMTWGSQVPPCTPPLPTVVPPPLEGDSCPAGKNGGKGALFDLPTSAPGSTPIRPLCGNPINFTTGSKIQYERDYESSSLQIVRRYDSRSVLGKALGPRWTHNYDFRLVEVTSNVKVYVARPNGKVQYFTPKAGQTAEWTSGAGATETLRKTASGWEYRDSYDTVETYDSSGKLVTQLRSNGQQTTYTYDGSGRLSQISDHFGRKLIFAYNATGLLERITLPDNGVLQYGYDAQGQLSTVTYPDGKLRRYGYTSVSVNGQNQDTLLTQLTDESGIAYALWGYDTTGAASSTEYAGGVERYSVTYQRDATGRITSATVLDPLMEQTTYTMADVDGVTRPVEAVRSSDNARRSQQFDANGNLTGLSNFGGVQSTFTYDLARNLETSRTIAAGTPQAKTITTEWHATLREPVKMTEPGKVTTFSYDANGNRLSKTVVADGISRTWSWTYTTLGQVATATQPDGQVTTYAYDSQGNLASITNGKNQQTRFTRYDASGRLLESVDPNNVITTLVYDARGRLLSKTVGGLVTRYTYEPNGLLATATPPDGNTVRYMYDHARRLSQITDSKGNQINYVRDAKGNVLQEDRRDPAGLLSGYAP